MSPSEAADLLAEALREVEPKIKITTALEDDEAVSKVSLDSYRMTLRTSYYDKALEGERLRNYAERVVERLRSEARR